MAVNKMRLSKVRSSTATDHHSSTNTFCVANKPASSPNMPMGTQCDGLLNISVTTCLSYDWSFACAECLQKFSRFPAGPDIISWNNSGPLASCAKVSWGGLLHACLLFHEAHRRSMEWRTQRGLEVVLSMAVSEPIRADPFPYASCLTALQARSHVSAHHYTLQRFSVKVAASFGPSPLGQSGSTTQPRGPTPLLCPWLLAVWKD